MPAPPELRKPRTASSAPAQDSAAPRRAPTSASSAGARDSLVGRKIQEYLVEERLGVGGMGVVYRAVHPLIGKHVAIKVLRPDVVTDPRDMDRLLEEARVVSAIKHRGIINIFGAGSLEDGRHFLIMELLEGESLEQRMQRDGQIPAADAVVILEQVLSALSAAHEAGIVHRDLKPANVFLVKEGAQYYVKLLDFGLARRQQQSVTRIAGTPDYISPEHARGRPAGPPADLYAFGVLCFHMLTGRLPFIGSTPMEVMEQHVHRAPPVPHELNAAIPKALSELILKLLAKDPGGRPDAPHVKADLRAATKQLRNAATMMSLAAIEPVASSAGEEEKRAKALARDAQVADLKRKAKRRWPVLVGGAVVAWLLGLLVFLLWPTTVEPPKRPVKDPVATKVTPAVVVDPTPVPAVAPPREPVPTEVVDVGPAVAEVVDAGAQPTEPLEQVPPVAAAEAPDAALPPQEDLDAVLDDVRLGELRREKRIDVQLDEVAISMRDVPSLGKLLKTLYEDAHTKCEGVQTLRQLRDCDDAVRDLYDRYRKNL